VAYLFLSMAKIHLDIRDPGMTFLHCAGVAGLFVQLKYLQKLKIQIPHGLDWSLTAQSIELKWTGKDQDALEWLFSQCFQIDDDGLIYFPAIEHSLGFRQRLAIHRGLQNSFLQHNQFFKSAGKVTRDEGSKKFQYRACSSYIHQKATKFLCDSQGDLYSKPIKITGWVYPGAIVQHELMKGFTQLVESPLRFLSLLFAPLACCHVSISSNLPQKNIQSGIIIPEVTDLKKYTPLLIHYWARGWADAALKFLQQSTPVKKSNNSEIHRCLVIPFGTVDWSKQQRTRLAMEVIEIDSQRLEDFCNFSEILKQDDILFQFIAENLIRQKPWWWGFSDIFTYEKAHLATKSRQNQLFLMVKKTEWDTEAQELFVRVCHQALRITFAKIYSKTKEGNYPQIERKLIELRSGLDRCQNSASFRDFITAFWGNAGSNKILQDSWEQLLPLTTGQGDWKMAKSLFYLSLASYKGEEAGSDDTKKTNSVDTKKTE
jgi:CRISPR-associated protein Cas8a1/Csx13